MRLIVTNPALDEALKAQGKDWHTFTRQEMRTVVCANCHVEYYFTGDGKYLTFPWEGGTRIENIAQYYADQGFKDWEHPQSGAPMIKMQHPEYELFTADSTHYKAGVACADCHMPYTRDGAAKFSTHDVKSPLLNAETCLRGMPYRCGVCDQHAWRRSRSRCSQTMEATEDALVAAIKAIEAAAATPGVDESLAGRSPQPASRGAVALGLHRRREQHGLPQPRRSPAHPGGLHRPGAPGAAEGRPGCRDGRDPSDQQPVASHDRGSDLRGRPTRRRTGYTPPQTGSTRRSTPTGRDGSTCPPPFWTPPFLYCL